MYFGQFQGCGDFNEKTEANLRFLHSVILPLFFEAVLVAVRPKTMSFFFLTEP